MRPLPLVTPETRPFWIGGADGELRLPRCPNCEVFQHPSMATCPTCAGAALGYAPVEGGGVVVAFSVNHQQWLPAMPPPYTVVIVELDGAPGVRLTSNLTGVDPGRCRVGMAVEVHFEAQGDVWFPLFRPAGGSERPAGPDRPGLVAHAPVVVRPPASPRRFEHDVALTGVGVSAVGRRLLRAPTSLAVEAAHAAVHDAGLEMADIDGLSTYPGALGVGMSEGGIRPLEEALRVRPTWHNGGADLPGQGGAVTAAMLAVASGLCRHVLCVRTVWEATYAHLVRSGELDIGRGGRVGDDMEWRVPFGATSAATWIGMAASQYFHRFGGDRTVLGRIAVNARQGAITNPLAVYRDPLTLDDYFQARMVSTPFGLFDCDVPCDGAVAIVVSAVETAADRPHGGVRVEAVGTQIAERVSWDQDTLTHEPMVLGPAAHLWTRTDLRPTDVDVALLYDGFTFNCLSWIEALGFCRIGEAADFVGDGSTISRTGPLPVNPHGGQLSAGRLHGFGFLHEAVLQLRGQAGAHQVDGAEVAVVSTGGGTPGGCFLLTAPR